MRLLAPRAEPYGSRPTRGLTAELSRRGWKPPQRAHGLRALERLSLSRRPLPAIPYVPLCGGLSPCSKLRRIPVSGFVSYAGPSVPVPSTRLPVLTRVVPSWAAYLPAGTLLPLGSEAHVPPCARCLPSPSAGLEPSPPVCALGALVTRAGIVCHLPLGWRQYRAPNPVSGSHHAPLGRTLLRAHFRRGRPGVEPVTYAGTGPHLP